MEGFLNTLKSERKKPLESRDQEIVDKLTSFGLRFDCSINTDGNLIYTFYDAKRLGDAAFLLSADNKEIIYQGLHFGEDSFEEPGSKRKITPDELIQYLLIKFPNAEQVICSCCNPDTARAFFTDDNTGIIFIGAGSGTYSTWYDEDSHTLLSVKNTRSLQE